MSKSDGSKSTPEQDPLHRYKSLVKPLLDRLREVQNSNVPRDKTDWWFPIILDNCQFVAKKNGGESKVTFPSFAGHLGISTEEFRDLKNSTNGKWKKMKQIQFPCLFRKHAGIEWILLGENEEGPILPKHQIDGKIQAPEWIGNVELDFKVVSVIERNHAQSARACAQKNELQEYEAETDDEDSNEEVMPAKKLGRPPGSKDEMIHFEMPNRSIVLVLKRYTLVSKQELKRSSLALQAARDEHEKLTKYIELQEDALRSLQSKLDTALCNNETRKRRAETSSSPQKRRQTAFRPTQQSAAPPTPQLPPPAAPPTPQLPPPAVRQVLSPLILGLKIVLEECPTRTLEQQKIVTSIIAVIIYSYRKSGRGDIVTLRIFNDELGVTRKVFEKALNAVNALEANSLPLTNLDSLLNRKVRDDIVRLKSINFIRDYSHNDDNSHRLDSNESNSKKIDGVRHRPRIWENVLTQDEKYADFQKSIEYQQFKAQNPTLTIGRTIFMEHVCKCIRNPTKESCVDLDYSAVEEYAISLRQAYNKDPALRNAISYGEERKQSACCHN